MISTSIPDETGAMIKGNIFKKALRKWGLRAQMAMLQEERGGLMAAGHE